MWIIRLFCVVGSLLLINGECVSREEFQDRLTEISLQHSADVSALKREIHLLKDTNVALEKRVSTLESSIQDGDIAKPNVRNGASMPMDGANEMETSIDEHASRYPKTIFGKYNTNQDMDIINQPGEQPSYKVSFGHPTTSESKHGLKTDEGKQIRSYSAGNSGTTNSGRSVHQKKRYLLGDLDEVSVPVAFSVLLNGTTDLTSLGTAQIVHFDEVITNLGNAFDIHLCVFTAPVTGWYAFSMTLMSREGDRQEVHVVKDGVLVFTVYSTGSDFNTGSRTMVVQLNKGQKVWVQTSQYDWMSHAVHGYGHTSFTGFLLYTADAM